MSDEIEIIIPHKEVIKDLQSRLDIAEAQLKVAVEALKKYEYIPTGETIHGTYKDSCTAVVRFIAKECLAKIEELEKEK